MKFVLENLSYSKRETDLSHCEILFYGSKDGLNLMLFSESASLTQYVVFSVRLSICLFPLAS